MPHPGWRSAHSQEEQPLRLERWRHMQPAQHSERATRVIGLQQQARQRDRICGIAGLQPKGTAQLIDSLRLVRLVPLAAQERELKQAPCIARLQCVACVKGILRFLRSPGRGIRQPQQIRRLSARVRLRVALEQRDCGEALLRSDVGPRKQKRTLPRSQPTLPRTLEERQRLLRVSRCCQSSPGSLLRLRVCLCCE